MDEDRAVCVGLDTHKARIAVAVAEPGRSGDVRFQGEIANQPEVRAEWAKQGASAMAMPPDQFAKYVTDDIAKWEKVIKVSGAKPDQ